MTANLLLSKWVGIPLISIPSTSILPFDMLFNRNNAFISEDFPQPVRPQIPTFCLENRIWFSNVFIYQRVYLFSRFYVEIRWFDDRFSAWLILEADVNEFYFSPFGPSVGYGFRGKGIVIYFFDKIIDRLTVDVQNFVVFCFQMRELFDPFHRIHVHLEGRHIPDQPIQINGDKKCISHSHSHISRTHIHINCRPNRADGSEEEDHTSQVIQCYAWKRFKVAWS